MKRQKLLVALMALCCMGMSATPAYAAKYSKAESREVRRFQRNYRALSKTRYTRDDIYTVEPNFSIPFSAGELDPDYISASMDYVNYYRSLVGLPREANYDNDNRNAQIGAVALAAVSAKQNLNVHGLLGYFRPNFMSEDSWDTAEISTLGNVNFLESNKGTTAGEVVTDLLRDKNNLSGFGNVGHRSLILSTRATRMGIGAAYGEISNTLYSVENGIFSDDILRTPVKDEVLYPAKKVFPYELATGKTPWSYSTTKSITGRPKVYITDLTKNKKKRYAARDILNFGKAFYGDGYSTTITYQPGKIKLVNTHKYKVEIGKHCTYTFRFFREKGKLK